MKTPPKADWQILLQQARTAWSADKPREALQLCARAASLPGGAPHMPCHAARRAAALLRGDILLQLGDAAGALHSYTAVSGSNDARLDVARGLALFELTRFSEAEAALQRALQHVTQLGPHAAEAYMALGIMREMRGNAAANACFQQARRLAPERFDLLPRLSLAQFDIIVQKALERLPHRVRTAMQAMRVVLLEMPQLHMLQQSTPPVSPQSFGMHVLTPEPVTAQIYLFKRNLERACAHETALIHAIRETVLDEVVAALQLPYDDDLEAWPGLN